MSNEERIFSKLIAPHLLHDQMLRRLSRNAGTLLVGQSGASLINIAAVAITANGLGLEGFGLLATIQAYAMCWDRLVNFQSFQVLIKFGTEYLHENDTNRVQALVKLTLLLDISSAMVGAALAIVSADFVGRLIGWKLGTTDLARLFCIVILFNISGTPIGLLRLLDRFRPLAIFPGLSAVLRLTGAAVVWLIDGNLMHFVIVWLLADIGGKLYLMCAGWLAARGGGYGNPTRVSIRSLLPLRSVMGFAVFTHLLSAIRLGSRELDMLIVAYFLGATGAGFFQMAKQFGAVLEKGVEPLYSAVFPEFSRLVAAKRYDRFTILLWQTAAFSAIIGIAAWIVIVFFGETLLRVVGGSEFIGAYGVLISYTFAIMLATAATPLQPAVLSLGRPRSSVWALSAATVCYLTSLCILAQVFGILGAGIGYIIFYLVWISIMTSVIWRWSAQRKTQHVG